jgi:hypothetical protein
MNSAFHFAMYAMTIFLHTISIGLYVYVAIRALRRPDIETTLKTTVFGACSFAILLSFVFSALQIEWMLSNRHDKVGVDASYFWLVFDYLLAVYLISMGQMLNVVTAWSRSSGRRRGPLINFHSLRYR